MESSEQASGADGTVLAPAPGVIAVPAPEGAVLVDLRHRTARVLNTSAAAVWACIDGRTPAAVIVTELADAFGVAEDLIRDDVEATLMQYQQQTVAVAVEPGSAGAPQTPQCADPALVERRDGLVRLRVPDSACQGNVDALGWAEVVTLAVDDHRIGVRADSSQTAALVRSVFAPVVVDDEADRNFSVALPEDATGPHKRSGFYDGNVFALGSEDRRAVFDALARRIASKVTTPAGSVRLEMVTIVGPAGAVLVPTSWSGMPHAYAELVARDGWTAELGPAWVDEADLVVAPAPSIVDRGALEPLGPGASSVVGAPVVAVVVAGGELQRLAGTDALSRVLPLVVAGPADDAEALFDRAAALTERLQVVVAPVADHVAIVDSLIGG